MACRSSRKPYFCCTSLHFTQTAPYLSFHDKVSVDRLDGGVIQVQEWQANAINPTPLSYFSLRPSQLDIKLHIPRFSPSTKKNHLIFFFLLHIINLFIVPPFCCYYCRWSYYQRRWNFILFLTIRTGFSFLHHSIVSPMQSFYTL